MRSKSISETAQLKTGSPRRLARIAGLVYVLVFVAGVFSLFVRTGIGLAAATIAGVLYIVVTVLFYFIFRPVNKSISLFAAIISLVGIIIGPLSLLVHLLSFLNPLVFFGIYCLLIGYLILRSTYLPAFLGALMIFAGLGWLTFLWPTLANALTPYNFVPGIIGEGALTLWLVFATVNEERWNAQVRQSAA